VRKGTSRRFIFGPLLVFILGGFLILSLTSSKTVKAKKKVLQETLKKTDSSKTTKKNKFKRPKPTADHSKFEALKGPFKDGPSVTKACLTCHTEAAKQLMKTRHWTWFNEVETLAMPEGKRKRVGKGGDIINNFCIAVASNEPRCTSCHAGYGWKNKKFDFSDETRVDCLICHDQTYSYKKYPTDAGHPVYKPKPWPKKSKKIWFPPDLAKVAQSVGLPTKKNCGSCHFSGGGGNGVKHGDMDRSLANPSRELDVHLSKDGGNLECTACHTTVEHDITGANPTLAPRDKHKFLQGGRFGSHMDCESCHTARPHTLNPEKGYDPSKATFMNNKLDDHTDKIACQTCHIPTFARVYPTKMWWDWSKAGKFKDGKGLVKKYVVKDGVKALSYHFKKGSFVWAKDETPEYYWYNGHSDQQFIGDTIDDQTPGKETTTKGRFDKIDLNRPVVPINKLHGNYEDPNARIWPVKVHRGIQPYDPKQKKLLVPKLFGKKGTGSYWTTFSWDTSLAKGMEYVNQPWSGQYDWIQTEMFWPLTHMVAPKEKALSCAECHSSKGRLEKLTSFYLPGRDRSNLLDGIGIAAIIFSILAGLTHGILRIVIKPKG
jgi:octaheme c-type cytochrome (tetrathionate reductase family)